VLAIALRGLGVGISAEALRLWLNRELGHKPVRRRRARMQITKRGAGATSPANALPERTATALPAAPTAAEGATTELPPKLTNRGSDRPSALILPGETPLQAFERRLAALGQTQARASGVN
jgi:hypothetical protein